MHLATPDKVENLLPQNHFSDPGCKVEEDLEFKCSEIDDAGSVALNEGDHLADLVDVNLSPLVRVCKSRA
jgi:hypothetical protein